MLELLHKDGIIGKGIDDGCLVGKVGVEIYVNTYYGYPNIWVYHG